MKRMEKASARGDMDYTRGEKQEPARALGSAAARGCDDPARITGILRREVRIQHERRAPSDFWILEGKVAA